MQELTVTLTKLEKYCKAHGGYELESKGNQVELSFIPNFPEAYDHGEPDQQPPRIMMHGQLSNGRVAFYKVEVEDQNGIREKEMEDASLTYSSWLEFIEDNY